MKVTYLILFAIVVLILLAVRYQYNERKAGMPDGMVKVCSPSHPNDCHYVDENIVNAVYEKALSIARSDNTETFPVESIDDDLAAYALTPEDLNTIRDAVAKELTIDLTECQDDFTSIQDLILRLHQCQQLK